MKEMRTEADIRASNEAARWHARLGAPDCSGLERARFEEWRTKRHENARASDSAARIDGLLEESGRLDEQLRAMTDEAFASGAAPGLAQRARRWALPAALAASAIVAALLVTFTREGGMAADSDSTTRFAAADVRRDVTLIDGSHVQLDVQSELSVHIAGRRRDIELVRGRAIFEVARDASRPFTVAAGSARVTALGTQFQVQRDPDRVTVTLAEGSVAVADTSAPSWRETLQPGEEVSVSSEPSAHVKHDADVQVATSWSSGRHVFRGTPLSRAVQEVNYYAARKVRLGDPQLATLRVGGNFVAGDSESVVAAFAAALPVRVVDAGNELILFRRYEAVSH